jgi:hypothetical protein
MSICFDATEKPWFMNIFPEAFSMLNMELQKLVDNAVK